MAAEYYIVGNLRKDYEETYSKLGNQWDKYAQRGYDIIDKVQKEDFCWLALIRRLMKVSEVLAKVRFVLCVEYAN